MTLKGEYLRGWNTKVLYLLNYIYKKTNKIIFKFALINNCTKFQPLKKCINLKYGNYVKCE